VRGGWTLHSPRQNPHAVVHSDVTVTIGNVLSVVLIELDERDVSAN
jgi:hypothetical protein